MTGRKRVAVLISGRGSNMAALIEAARAPDYPAEIVCVISNRPQAPGLDIARAEGIESTVIDHKAFGTRAAFETHLHDALASARVDLVCSAGFLRLFTADFVARWYGRLMNIHPSLLPSFRGLHPHEQALAAGVRISGCTVHFVSAEMDAGPIIAQAAVPVMLGDTAESLSARILAAEHRLYPLALRLVASGAVTIAGAMPAIETQFPGDAALFCPPLQAANT